MKLSDLKHVLSAWGLKENESKVFLYCLQNPQGLYVHEIVTGVKLKRSTIDLVLRRLCERKFIVKLRIGNRYQYFPEKAESLLLRQQQNIELFQLLLPLLLQFQQGRDAPDVRIYQGVEGISQHYQDMISILGPLPPEEKRLLSIESGDDVMRIRPDLEKFFIRERIKRGIHIDIICPQKTYEIEAYQTNKQKLRECRYFKDKDKLFSMAFYLYTDRVALISLKSPLQVVVIRHEVVSRSMRTIWQLLWVSLSS